MNATHTYIYIHKKQPIYLNTEYRPSTITYFPTYQSHFQENTCIL